MGGRGSVVGEDLWYVLEYSILGIELVMTMMMMLIIMRSKLTF